MKEFIETYERYRDKYGWNLEIYNSSIMDWRIAIGYKSTHPKTGEVLIHIQSCDLEYAIAKAQIELKDWLSENNNGY